VVGYKVEVVVAEVCVGTACMAAEDIPAVQSTIRKEVWNKIAARSDQNRLNQAKKWPTRPQKPPRGLSKNVEVGNRQGSERL
jgi:hypothetical protein